MAIISRDWHQIDESHGTFNTRKIGKWLNYRTPGGLFAPIDSALEDAGDVPNDWQGAYEFELEAKRQPLEIRIGDNTDANNKALWGLRLSAQPDCWMNYKAVNVNTVTPVRNYAERTVTWTGLWDFTNFQLEVGRHRCDQRITLTAPGHPVAFRFAIRLPAGCSHTIADNQLKFFHPVHGQYMRSVPGNGRDANNAIVPVSYVSAPDITVGQKTFPTYRVVPDVSAAVYPVVL
jgi:hypothetical protein